MTNKELQQRTEQIIKSLGSYDDWKRGKKLIKNEWVKIKNPFLIGRTYAYNIARGKFDKCGKHGILIMKNYFRELELNKHIDKSFEQYDQVYKNLKDK